MIFLLWQESPGPLLIPAAFVHSRESDLTSAIQEPPIPTSLPLAAIVGRRLGSNPSFTRFRTTYSSAEPFDTLNLYLDSLILCTTSIPLSSYNLDSLILPTHIERNLISVKMRPPPRLKLAEKEALRLLCY